MRTFEVTMARPGGGSGTFKVTIHAGSPNEARSMAEHQNPGYKAISVRG